MAFFAEASDGIRLAYEIVGDGAPIVLVHGFASDRAQNWKNVGWYETLTAPAAAWWRWTAAATASATSRMTTPLTATGWWTISRP